MNDERLSELLATHAGPAAVDDAFEDRLYSILEGEMRRGRSLRPALLLVAALVVVLTITGAIAVGSGLIEPPWVHPSPIPDSSAPLEWSGPVRHERPEMVVHPVGTGTLSWPEDRDAASGWVDITRVDTYDPSAQWRFELAAAPPGLAALAASHQILAYGVVLETTGDDVADWVVGIDNNAPEGELHQWVTDLATGQTEENVGAPYGPLFDFAHPTEGSTPHSSRLMNFVFLFSRWSTPIRFYTWASLTQAGKVVAWDYAPDASWLVADPTPEQ
jgi:hypothetical protein